MVGYSHAPVVPCECLRHAGLGPTACVGAGAGALHDHRIIGPTHAPRHNRPRAPGW